MNAWSPAELETFGNTDELQISSDRGDGERTAPITIWAVPVGGQVYVRSVRGRKGGWFSGAKAKGSGHVQIGAVDRDVTFEPVSDPQLQDQISKAYQDKYARYARQIVDSTLSPQALQATLRVDPS